MSKADSRVRWLLNRYKGNLSEAEIATVEEYYDHGELGLTLVTLLAMLESHGLTWDRATQKDFIELLIELDESPHIIEYYKRESNVVD